MGLFWIELGKDELFRYTPEILAKWGVEPTPYPDYQLASFVRDLYECAAPGLAPLPEELARVAGDVERLAELDAITRRAANERGEKDRVYDNAWRWLGARSPWMSYLVECPKFYFVRLGDEIEIGYDNRARVIDGVPVWTAQLGAHRMPVEAFKAAIATCTTGLLDAMAARIDDLEHGRATPQAPVDVASLRTQHAKWAEEFSQPLEPSPEPDVSWDETLAALRTLGVRV